MFFIFSYFVSYFSEIERILEPGYTPTELDVLHSRVQTTGIIETSFKVGKLTYRCDNFRILYYTCTAHVFEHTCVNNYNVLVSVVSV